MKHLAFATSILSSALVQCADIPVIERDLAIIGGGSSGSYSAITAKQDYGLSVVIIEKQPQLGGHVSYWDDPVTGRTYECGVQTYLNISGAQRHFDRLGVPTGLNARSSILTLNVDFTTGQNVPFVLPSSADSQAAFRKYVEVTQQYQSRMEPGYHNFYKAGEIPEDLLMPFAKFIEKYNLTAAVPQFYYLTGFNSHSFNTKPAAAFFRALPPDFIRTILNEIGSLNPASKRNQDIYDASRRLIGDDNILFNSVPETITSDIPVEDKAGQGKITLIVRNLKTGDTTKIIAKRLLFTAIPTTENIAVLPVKTEMKQMISTMWTFPSTAIVSVISHPALPANSSLSNTPAAAAPQNFEHIMPQLPHVVGFTKYPDSDKFRATAAGDETLTLEGGRQVIQAALDGLIKTGALKDPGPPQPITFHVIKSHGTGGAFPVAEDMRAGFWDKFIENDGKGGVWFTGRWWGVEVSTHIWQECEVTMKKIVASLAGN